MRRARLVVRAVIAVGALAVVVLSSAAEVGWIARRPVVEFWILVGTGGWVFLESLAAIVRSARRPRRVGDQRKIERVLTSAVVALSRNTGVPIEDLGANAFGIRRWSRAWWPTPRLVRLARFRPSDRLQPSRVDWVLGKGAIGEAWRDEGVAHIDLRSIARAWFATAQTEEEFDRDFAADAHGLTFAEFRATTGKYAETAAVAIADETGAVIGVVSLDRQLRDDADDLVLDNQATRDLLHVTASGIRDLVPSSYALGQEEAS
jgi:hypothetical protein